MEMESGKLFVGGISWETNEDLLREYFQNFGEVLEAVIIKDRNTGRARGFGFVVFADPYVAERVVKEKHVIDGRTVEAKKAVPRDEQLNRSNGSSQGSPGPTRTKKIFVGGLASTVTDIDFKNYFDQFGSITDVIVMYDHNTKRPRGFGFITYDSEDAVDRVLLKPFHELNGKMVEVKRAVPKELSPGLTRTPVGGHNLGLNRVYPQGYNTSSMGEFGMRLEGRGSPVTVGRNGYIQYSPNYSMGPNIDSILSPEYTGNGSFSPNNIGHGRVMNPLSGAFSNRYIGPMGYGGGMDVNDSILNSTGRNIWDHGNFGYGPRPSTPNDIFSSENRITEPLGGFGSIGPIGRGRGTGRNNVRFDDFGEGIDFMAGEPYGSNIGRSLSNVAPSDRPFGNSFASTSVYDDPTWQSSSLDLMNSGDFSHIIKNITSIVAPDSSPGYVDGYNVTSRANRGIAA